MSAPEVEYLLDRLADAKADLGEPLYRIDRDAAAVRELDIHSSEVEPAAANLVSVSLADRAAEPIGTEYDHELETTVSVRVSGAHYREKGHVDPAGERGDRFRAVRRAVRSTILADRVFPSVGAPDIGYTHLRIPDETDLSAEYAEDFRAELTVRFDGFETLP